MIWLTDKQWERIRDHFPEEHIADGRPGRNPLRVGARLKWCCGFSIPARSGICCRKAIRTTKLCTGAFRLGVATRTLRRILTDVANDLRDRGVLDEEECFIDATFVMAKGGGAEIQPRSAEKA